MIDDDEIRHRFEYHPPRSTARVRDHEFARNLMGEAAMSLARLLPEGREKSTCITKLEEAMMWANASLARSPDLDATASEEEAAAGPRRFGEGEPALDRDDEERSSSGPAPHSFEMVDLPDVYDPYTCKRCGEHKEDEIHTDPREGLDPDEQLCTAPVADHEQCAEPAVGYVVLPGQRRPLCRYHLVQDDSGGAIERFR